MLALQDVGKIYIHQKFPITALSQIQLTLDQNQTLGILGKANSGKTSLIRCITMMDPPTSGSITFAQTPLTQLSKKAARTFQQENIGYISSPEQLLVSRTVFDNIVLPLECMKLSKQEIIARVSPLLELTQLQDKSHLYPAQLNMRQKQKVAIARSLIKYPKLVLWDDIAASLDLYSTQHCMNILIALQNFYKFSLIMTAETLEIIKPLCDHIAVLHQGTIIEHAPTLELLSHPISALTKELIRHASRAELPTNLRKNIQIHSNPDTVPLFKMTFRQKLNYEPILTHIIRTFNIMINILHATVEILSQGDLGVLVIEMSGSSYNIEQAVHYLETEHVYTEKLGYVTRNTKCM